MPKLHVTPDLGAVAGPLLVEALQGAVARAGTARLAIAGGSSVVPVFQWLAEHLPDELAHVLTVTWADERHLVEHNSEGAWKHWLSRARVLPRVVELDAEGPLERARALCEARFVAEVGGLDAVLLGAGPDGHIASLFPGHPALSEAGPVLAIADSPKPPPERLTLSLPVLEDVECAVFVASGAAKAAMLARAFRGDDTLPLGRYHPTGDYHWVCDPDAAQEL